MENTVKTNVATQIVNQLADAGVKRIYAITGDSLNAITDTIVKDGRIKFIHMRHEESGAFAASAESQLTGKLSAVAGSSGPGHIHLINGLYDAQRSDTPVVAIASTCPASMYGTGYFQETNPILLFSNCSVYNQMAERADQVSGILHLAMQNAISKGGVGIIGLPQDIITDEISGYSTTQIPFYTNLQPEPSDEEIIKVAELINQANKVAIFAGYGAREAVNLVKEISHKLKAPVITSYKSQMELSRDMPNYIGHLAHLGMWSADEAVMNADINLILGTNFPFPGFFKPEKCNIQVDIRGERLGKKANLEMGICSDIGIFLKKLLPFIKVKLDDSFLKTALSNFGKIKEKLQIPIKNPGKEGCIRPEYMVSLLDKYLPEDGIVCVDTGMNNLWTSHYLTPKASRKMIGSFMHGSMANALPMAIGAKLSCPEKEVVALCGDGGLEMLMGELLTVVQYNLPIKIIVADNRSLGFVKWEMEAANYKPYETDLVNPDLGKVADSIGIHAETVTTPEKLEEAMKELLEYEGPALLNVMTDPDAASFTFSKELMDKSHPGNPVSNFILPGC
ncbi:MAG: ubiquinone-dependent pyruvate dehydrogenase [Muribaculaceae bacterium]|nr:ubiquinone-dependent pyruvate dehydrogenase [Muribaculaceae bacterium]